MTLQIFGKRKRGKSSPPATSSSSDSNRHREEPSTDNGQAAEATTYDTAQLPASRRQAEKALAVSGEALVRELLTQDPSSWNSKQRRIVKRYRERRKDELEGECEVDDKDDTDHQDPGRDVESSEHPLPSSSLVSESDQNSSSVGAAEEGAPSDSVVVEKQATAEGSGDGGQKNSKQVVQEASSSSASSPLDSISSNHLNLKKELDGLMGRLSSKIRRKLSRQIDRGELSVVEGMGEVRRLLAENASSAPPQSEQRQQKQPKSALVPSSVAEGKYGDKLLQCEDQSGQETSRKRQRNKKESVDWNLLPAEERIRREEQRRMQQVAAEKRKQSLEQQENSGQEGRNFRHPLNSERRRANRRKPKHPAKKRSEGHGTTTAAAAASSFVTKPMGNKKKDVSWQQQQLQDHHTSGYQVRKAK
jgi:hypothetical protein